MHTREEETRLNAGMLINRACLWSTISKWEGKVANTLIELIKKTCLASQKIRIQRHATLIKFLDFKGLPKHPSKIKKIT